MDIIITIISSIIALLISLIVYIWKAQKARLEKMEDKIDNLDKTFVRRDLYENDIGYIKDHMKELKDCMVEFMTQLSHKLDKVGDKFEEHLKK
jgi:hypothetical protein